MGRHSMYDLYKIVRGKEVFVGRMERGELKEKYGLSLGHLRNDIESKKVKKGLNGEYHVRYAGDPPVFQPEDIKMQRRISGMPQHVSRYKDAGSCRFEG